LEDSEDEQEVMEQKPKKNDSFNSDDYKDLLDEEIEDDNKIE